MSPFPYILGMKENSIRFRTDSVIVRLNLADKHIEHLIRLPHSAQNLDFSPEESIVAYTMENNLFLAGKERSE